MRLIARRIAEETGMTVIIALGVMTVSLALTGAAFTAVIVDQHTTRDTLLQKRALAAAEAGLQWYTFQLDSNVNYWTNCPSETHMEVPNTSGQNSEYFSFTQLPASSEPTGDYIGGNPACNSSDPIGSMIESGAGPNPTAANTFRVEFNGYAADQSYANTQGNGIGVERSIVVTFHRDDQLSYVYYTVNETDYQGNVVQFVTGDSVNGPLATQGTIHICGDPVFGRAGHEPPDVVDVNNGQTVDLDCNGSSPVYNTPTSSWTNTLVPGPPQSDSQLSQIAGVTYTGQTTIVLQGTSYCVTNASVNNGTQVCNQPFPSNGVMYIAGCQIGEPTYDPTSVSYPGPAGCAEVYVSGTYSDSLTIASADDIIVNGNITTNLSTSSLLGLIANGWVRVYHPCSNNNNGTGTMQNVTIDAAIMAVVDSFQVDNYSCGNALGDLNITGAISQQYRGTVGTHSGTTVTSGYSKNYVYDDRLAAEEPPYFLSPITAAWSVERENECTAVDTSTSGC